MHVYLPIDLTATPLAFSEPLPLYIAFNRLRVSYQKRKQEKTNLWKIKTSTFDRFIYLALMPFICCVDGMLLCSNVESKQRPGPFVARRLAVDRKSVFIYLFIFCLTPNSKLLWFRWFICTLAVSVIFHRANTSCDAPPLHVCAAFILFCLPDAILAKHECFAWKICSFPTNKNHICLKQAPWCVRRLSIRHLIFMFLLTS